MQAKAFKFSVCQKNISRNMYNICTCGLPIKELWSYVHPWTSGVHISCIHSIRT